MDEISNTYLTAYRWLMTCKTGKWIEVNETQEKVLKDIWQVGNGPVELTFKEGAVMVKRWEKGKPYVVEHKKKFANKRNKK